MDAQSMAIMAAASSSVSTPGVVRELMAENRRLQAENLRLQACVEHSLAEFVAVADHRDEILQQLRDAHADEFQRFRVAHSDVFQRFRDTHANEIQHLHDAHAEVLRINGVRRLVPAPVRERRFCDGGCGRMLGESRERYTGDCICCPRCEDNMCFCEPPWCCQRCGGGPNTAHVCDCTSDADEEYDQMDDFEDGLEDGAEDEVDAL